MKPLKQFVPLDKKQHDRKSFDCGNNELNRFLSQNAKRGMDARVNFTWVLPAAGIPKIRSKPICAYYTISVCHIERDILPDKIAKSLPRYPLPAFILAQLAVDKRCQGQGLGDVALVNALRRCVQLSQNGQVPGIAVILDVVDDNAMAFYRRLPDFELLDDNASMLPRLFLPIKVVERI
ncbi:MAG: GNAT superfamily N-acetyltransferase [Phenylobacterium sp.]|jgi:GNAT superfamily N-acetyltransferase